MVRRRPALDAPALGTSSTRMMIRIIRHEAVPHCGSYEVRFPDGRPSKYFYWEEIPGRRLRSKQADSKQALEEAKAFARAFGRVGEILALQ
jgi:hypothetical protein